MNMIQVGERLDILSTSEQFKKTALPGERELIQQMINRFQGEETLSLDQEDINKLAAIWDRTFIYKREVKL